MDPRNPSSLTEFILTGLTEQPQLRLPLFLLFPEIYVITVMGSQDMITLIGLSSHLHTHMYYFLINLSFIGLCQSTVITPKMLVNFVTEKNIIFYHECMTQLYFFLLFIIAESCMLAEMVYDCYAAICKCLLYNAIISYYRSFQLTAAVYILWIIQLTFHTCLTLRLYFCKASVINHYFCDVFPLVELSCSSIYFKESLALVCSSFKVLIPALTILISYIFILYKTVHIHSTEGRSKAFSTCSSHILAVAVLYGSAAFMYLQPSSVSPMDQGNVSSVFYTGIVPMLNPLTYTLQDKDVKLAPKKILESGKCR
ncbi:putative olfactory receptor 8G3 [Odocoileus virginianus]|uniref:putative olfactory receptor 8G3 n=1 Tax=Odocoileus virginianus TaxID=9874 RepID=UPI0038F62EA5